MNYVSNLVSPDLTHHFKNLVSRPMGHSFGHDVPSDWSDKADDDPVFGIYKRCGCWTTDERAILFHVARQVKGIWCDIGCHTGLTSKTINWATNSFVDCVDPMLGLPEFRQRWRDNTGFPSEWGFSQRSDDFFANEASAYSGVVIDGCHEPGQPLRDAENAAHCLMPDGVILLHDFIGEPVREAVRYLMTVRGMDARVYWTPHVVALCWHPGSGFVPPDHVPDPGIVAQRLPARMPDFADYLERLK